MRLWLLLTLPFMATACMPSVKSVTTDPHAAQVEKAMETPVPDVTKTGSLWANGGAIFTDTKASHVGDLLTVLVSEKTSATRSLGTKKSRKSARKTGLSGFFGFPQALAAKNANFKPGTAVDLTNESSFDGSGSTNNSDTLTASVTAVVTKVYPNGNMRVIGRRQVTINHQPQALSFSGVVRSKDIAPNNTISSAKVAQAVISYGGGGGLATVAQEGWLARSLDQVWPF